MLNEVLLNENVTLCYTLLTIVKRNKLYLKVIYVVFCNLCSYYILEIILIESTNFQNCIGNSSDFEVF